MNRSKMRSRFERADLLAAGLALCSFLLVEEFSVKVWLLIMWVILRRRQPLALALITLLFGCSFLLRAPLPASAPDTQIIRVEQIKSSYVIAEAKGQRVVVYGLKQPSFGDIVRVSGTWKQLHSDHNFGQFSFDDYMAKRGVRYRISSEESETLSQGNTLRAQLFRQAWQSEGKSRELLLSLIYGIQEEGSYLLSACGLHLSSLAHWLKKLAGKRLAKRQSQAAAVIFLALAGSLTNFSDSLFRVLCTQMAGLLPGSTRDAAGLSILLVLLFRPYMVSEMSFVLPTVLRLAFLFNRSRLRARALSMLVVIPLQLCFFHEIAIVQTLLFQPLRTMYALLYVPALLGLFMPACITPLLGTAALLEQLSAAAQTWVLTYYPSVLWILCWIWLLLRLLKENKARTWGMLALLLAFSQVEGYLDPFFEVMIIDVGQGDCALISLPHRQGTLMIDAAGSLYRSIPRQIIAPLLKDKKIDRIDKLILTHDDHDHSGGLQELSEIVEIAEVITVKEDVEDPLLVQALIPEYAGEDENENSIVSWFGWDGLHYLFMGDLGVKGEKEILRRYDALPCDILKIGHHGSDTSSSAAFLHALRPQLALISVGHDNRYGHPSETVLQTLDKEGIPYYSTAEDGAILIRTTALFKYVRTARGEFAIMRDR